MSVVRDAAGSGDAGPVGQDSARRAGRILHLPHARTQHGARVQIGQMPEVRHDADPSDDQALIMLKSVIDFSLKNKFIVLLATLALAGGGGDAFVNNPLGPVTGP